MGTPVAKQNVRAARRTIIAWLEEHNWLSLRDVQDFVRGVGGSVGMRELQVAARDLTDAGILERHRDQDRIAEGAPPASLPYLYNILRSRSVLETWMRQNAMFIADSDEHRDAIAICEIADELAAQVLAYLDAYT